MKRFSKKWIYKALRKAVAKLQSSDIDESIKKAALKLPLFVTVNTHLRKTAGQLYIIRKNYHDVSKIPQDKKDWTVLIDNKISYVVLELSAHHIYWESPAEVENTTIHELAHALDFIENGYEKRNECDIHNEDWQEIHSALGLKPQQFCDVPDTTFLLEEYQRIALAFDSEEID